MGNLHPMAWCHWRFVNVPLDLYPHFAITVVLTHPIGVALGEPQPNASPHRLLARHPVKALALVHVGARHHLFILEGFLERLMDSVMKFLR